MTYFLPGYGVVDAEGTKFLPGYGVITLPLSSTYYESELSLLNVSGLSAGVGLGSEELDAIFVGRLTRS